MGCDIHCYMERKIDGEWVTADAWDPHYNGLNEPGIPWRARYNGRNYALFGLLSKGVRSEGEEYGIPSRGLPDDCCPEVMRENEIWGCDGHSHSWLTLTELKELRERLKTAILPVSGMLELSLTEDSGPALAVLNSGGNAP